MQNPQLRNNKNTRIKPQNSVSKIDHHRSQSQPSPPHKNPPGSSYLNLLSKTNQLIPEFPHYSPKLPQNLQEKFQSDLSLFLNSLDPTDSASLSRPLKKSTFLKPKMIPRKSRSASPPREHKYLNKDTELKILLTEITILREENELSLMRLKCYESKLFYIVLSVQNFLGNTSKIQKKVREKEGYKSLKYYEDEKALLEMKIKEVAEHSDVHWKPPGVSFFRTFATEERAEVGQNRNKIKKDQNISEKINMQLIEELTKRHKDKTDGLENNVRKLENDNRKLRNKFLVVKKQMKQVKNLGNRDEKSILKKLSNFEAVKEVVEDLALNYSGCCESTLSNIKELIEEKNKQILDLKVKIFDFINAPDGYPFIEGKSIKKYKNLTQDCGSQIKILEKTPENKKPAEWKINETLKHAEKFEENNSLKSIINSLEKKVSDLSEENNSLKNLEKIIKQKNEIIKTLESSRSSQIFRIQSLEKNELTLQQCKIQRDLFEQENQKLVQEFSEISSSLAELKKIRKAEEEESRDLIECLSLENTDLKRLLFAESALDKPGSLTARKPGLNFLDKNPITRFPSDQRAQKNRNPGRSSLYYSEKTSKDSQDLKKEVLSALIKNELLSLELRKSKESHKAFEKFLKSRINHLERPI